MRELMDAEGSSALRRAKLTRSFNNGYRSYSRTYNSCTPSAQTAITRFLTEGAEIADGPCEVGAVNRVSCPGPTFQATINR